MPNVTIDISTKLSLFEVSYNDLETGVEATGRLFVNDNGKLAFEGNAEESARVFFEEYLKPMCEKHIDLIIDKVKYPLFHWKESR